MGDSSEQKPSTEFHVVLDGLRLAADVEQRIESEIRRVVMRELAHFDDGGDYTIVARNKFPKSRGFGGGTMGAVMRF